MKADIIRIDAEAYGDVALSRLEHLERFAAIVRADEREKCAKCCDLIASLSNENTLAANCADAIRDMKDE